jgi:molecular chaperone DnaK
MARDNWPLGRVEVPFEPAPKGQARVGVQFEIDADGILRVLVRDTQTGEEQQLEIQSAVDVSDEAVEKMVAESVEFALDDMNERVLTETKLKSEELIASVDQALEMAGGDLAADDRAAIENLAKQIRAELEKPAPEEGGGDLQARVETLQELNEKLDRATQRLATILVERALGS